MKISLQQTIGLNVRAARIGKGLTQGQLAERVGCAWETISRIERGRNPPTVLLLHDMAKALNASIDELTAGEGRRSTPSRHRKELEIISMLKSVDDDSIDTVLRIVKSVMKEFSTNKKS